MHQLYTSFTYHNIVVITGRFDSRLLSLCINAHVTPQELRTQVIQLLKRFIIAVNSFDRLAFMETKKSARDINQITFLYVEAKCKRTLQVSCRHNNNSLMNKHASVYAVLSRSQEFTH